MEAFRLVIAYAPTYVNISLFNRDSSEWLKIKNMTIMRYIYYISMALNVISVLIFFFVMNCFLITLS